MKHWNTSVAIYVGIAMLAAIPPFVVDGTLPKWVACPVAVLTAGGVAWKAKRSAGITDSSDTEEARND